MAILTESRRLRALVALVAAAALALTACGRSDQGGDAETDGGDTAGKTAKEMLPEAFEKGGVLRVATAVGYPPMEMYKPGTTELTGVDPDLARALADELGLELKLTNAAFDGLIPGLKSGRFDLVMSSMTDSPQRRQAVDFVDYFRTGGVIMVKKGNPEGITTLDGLCGKAVVLAKGSSNLEIGQQQNAKCGEKMRISQSEDAPTGLLQLESGRAVATIVDYPVAQMFAEKNPAYEVVPTQYGAAPWGIAVSKEQSGLRDAVHRALQTLIDNGAYKKVLDEYGVAGSAVPRATINDGQ
ncbi:ABC transporter substrate-binding protein [Streptomyces sp. LE64]|uniref:ABC transporter substrate-binding protein n=1 Tax=Streptomyces sp. LE64 TaxID=3448653 RepID=UPI0040431FCA